MRLVCRKYEWSSSLGLNDVNFFSTFSKTLIEEIDLKYYLEKNTLSAFGQQFEGINATSNELELKLSNVSLRCKNEMTGRTSLQDFFEMYDSNPYIKFRFHFYDNDDVERWSGLIYKDGVEYAERRNDMIDIIVVSEEKEFMDYFSDKGLVYPTSSVSSLSLFGTGLNGLKFWRLIRIIEANFPTADLGSVPDDYYIADVGYTYAPLAVLEEMGEFFHIKTGFDSFVKDGYNRFEYFNSLCMGMGWIWYFYLGKLYVKDRGGSETNQTHTLNYQTDFISHGISSDLLNEAVDSIIIDNGSYYDNLGNGISTLNGLSFFDASTNLSYNMSGESGEVVTKYEYNNKNTPFVLTYNGSIYLNQWDYLNATRFIASSQSQESYYVYEDIYLNNVSPYTVTKDYYYYPIKRVLNIRPVINSDYWASGIDKAAPRTDLPPETYYGNGNFYVKDTTATSQVIMYRGNPASSLIKYNPTTGKYITYEVASQRESFRNNFKKFIRGANPVLFRVRVKGLIWDVFKNIEIVNYPFSDLSNKSFSIQSLDTDFINNWTDLTLQMNDITEADIQWIINQGDSTSDFSDYIINEGDSTSDYSNYIINQNED